MLYLDLKSLSKEVRDMNNEIACVMARAQRRMAESLKDNEWDIIVMKLSKAMTKRSREPCIIHPMITNHMDL